MESQKEIFNLRNKVPPKTANNGRSMTLDKKNSSKANFNFGTFHNKNFQSISHTDYVPKTPMINTNNEKNINKRGHSYKMGDHQLDYMSDNNLRYNNPNVKKSLKYIFCFILMRKVYLIFFLKS